MRWARARKSPGPVGLQGFPVQEHRKIHQVSQVYQSFGVELGQCEVLAGRVEPGYVVVCRRERRCRACRGKCGLP